MAKKKKGVIKKEAIKNSVCFLVVAGGRYLNTAVAAGWRRTVRFQYATTIMAR